MLSAVYLADLINSRSIDLPRRQTMDDYDPDDYEYQELLAERRHAKKNNRYFAQGDPEAPEPDDEESSDERD